MSPRFPEGAHFYVGGQDRGQARERCARCGHPFVHEQHITPGDDDARDAASNAAATRARNAHP